MWTFTAYEFIGSIIIASGVLIYLCYALPLYKIKGHAYTICVVIVVGILVVFVVRSGPVEWTLILLERNPHEWNIPRQVPPINITQTGKIENSLRDGPYRFTPGIGHSKFKAVLESPTTLLFEIPNSVIVAFDPRLKIWTKQGPGSIPDTMLYTAKIDERISRTVWKNVNESVFLTISAKEDYKIRYRVEGVIAKTQESFETDWQEFTIHIF